MLGPYIAKTFWGVGVLLGRSLTARSLAAPPQQLCSTMPLQRVAARSARATLLFALPFCLRMPHMLYHEHTPGFSAWSLEE
jgi:hypothetical protein